MSSRSSLLAAVDIGGRAGVDQAFGYRLNVAQERLRPLTRNLDGAELFLTTTGGKSPAVILSHGANGLGATDQQGNVLAAPPEGSDEASNASADGKLFFSRPASDNPAAPGGSFDDRVTWLSPNLLAHRLISAGTLP
mgnify:CR=1 FL=1